MTHEPSDASVARTLPASEFDCKCRNGDKYKCPNMKYDDNDRSMESELYECAVCGERYKLYYEDMA